MFGKPLGNNQSPAISVVMSAYNAEQYVSSAVESILNQTFRDFEFIIINDGSTDSTGHIARSYAARDSRIRLVEQDNTGLTIALRRGIDISAGEFIARMDADDISMPTRLEKQIEFLRAQSDYVAVSSIIEHFKIEDETGYLDSPIKVDETFPLFNCFTNAIGGHGQVAFRRRSYDLVGGYDPTVTYAQDYDLWTRLTDLGKFGVAREMLYRMRRGHDSITKVHASKQAVYSLRTCRREYKKLTGEGLDESTSIALRSFWWGEPAENTSLQETKRISTAMSIAIDSFFKTNPGLRKYQFVVEKSIAGKWWWRISKRNGIRLGLLLLILTGYWCARAVVAYLRDRARPHYMA